MGEEEWMREERERERERNDGRMGEGREEHEMHSINN